jgi:hypothetical protein
LNNIRSLAKNVARPVCLVISRDDGRRVPEQVEAVISIEGSLILGEPQNMNQKHEEIDQKLEELVDTGGALRRTCGALVDTVGAR